MNKQLSSIIFLLVNFIVFAQQGYNTKNLIVSKSDLQLNTYSQDSTANAFFIYEKGYSRIQNNGSFNLITDYQAKVKILNQKGFDNANIRVVLYNNERNAEKIHNIKAFTYNYVNGVIEKKAVSPSAIYREKYSDNHTLIKFTFPDLKPGSVITYSYQLETPFIFNFNGWEFQDDIPKRHSEYRCDIPGNYIYNIKLVGGLKLTHQNSEILRNCITLGASSSADCAKLTYVMKDIPAFISEKYMTAKKNYLSRISFELSEFKGFDGTIKKYTKSWKDVDKELKNDPDIGYQLRKLLATKHVLPQNIQSKANSLEKATEIYNYLVANYSWNEENRIYNDISIKDILKERTGNVAEINILLHNVLKQQKFDVKPILLSTRKNGYPTTIHPVISDFNYLIVQLQLNDKTYLLDATEKDLAFGQIPFRALNIHGRLLDFKNGSSWITLSPQQRSQIYFKDEYVLTENGEFKGTSEQLYTGYHASFKKNNLKNISEDDYIQKIKDQLDQEDIDLTSLIFENKKSKIKPYKEIYTHTKTFEDTPNLLFIEPFFGSFFSENPFKLNHRTYPVDFGFKDNYTHFVKITIPEGYVFEEVPQSKNYKLSDGQGTVTFAVKQQDNALYLNLRIKFNSHIYPAEHYQGLKTLFSHIIDIQNNTTLLIKKKA
ncbi:DUF3857 domain-containing protein [Aquimarina rhabdastrellae]